MTASPLPEDGREAVRLHLRSYRLRPAAPDDADALFRLHRAAMGGHLARAYGRSWSDDFARERHDRWLAEGRAQVVELDGLTVGALDVVWAPDGMQLNRIEIDPALHGQGLGTAILRDLLGACGRRGTPAHLQVFPHNPARRLYRRLGFLETGTDGAAITMRWDPQHLS